MSRKCDKEAHLDARWEQHRMYPEVEVMYRKVDGEWVETGLHRYNPDTYRLGLHAGSRIVGQ